MVDLKTLLRDAWFAGANAERSLSRPENVETYFERHAADMALLLAKSTGAAPEKYLPSSIDKPANPA